MKFHSSLIARNLCLLSLLLIIPVGANAQMRKWTASNGRTLDAEFVGTSGAGTTAKVKLKMESGEIIDYPVSKLSEADRIFVKGNIPTDPIALAAEIDKLVLDKLKKSYYGLKDELEKLPTREDLSDTDKARRKEEIERELAMCAPNPKTTDNQFVRRIYLDIAGRIPTFEEANAFLDSRDSNKRSKLIDELLDSPAFGMRMFNHYGDLFRVREGFLPKASGNGVVSITPYNNFIKDSVTEDKPYDQFVTELLASTGNFWDNPGVGYFKTDAEMPLCNLSNTFTVFLGTDISCAECHDHPFEEVYQMDFYKLASFFGNMKVGFGRKQQDFPMYFKQAKAAGATFDYETFADFTAERKRLNQLVPPREGGRTHPLARTLLNHLSQTNSVVFDGKQNQIRLPNDYKYDDGEPEMKVKAGTYFGDVVNIADYENPRQAFAAWMTSPSNPRFTINAVNRFWKLAFGLGQIEPVDNIPGHLDGQAQNYELLLFLEEMFKELDFSVKGFFRVIYNTEAYQREAEQLAPSLTQIDRGTYHFPGPVLRRMTAEQMWDSLVTLTTDDPEGITRVSGDFFRKYMNTDTTKITSIDGIRQLDKMQSRLNSSIRKDGTFVSEGETLSGFQMHRASELRQPMAPSHLLRTFGQSDKLLVENSFKNPSSPQILSLLNGAITNDVLSNPDAYLIKEIAEGGGARRDKIDKIFLSVLTRAPSSEEKSAAQSGMGTRRARDDSDQARREAKADAIGNVIWALVNTREFIFIQ